MSPQQARMYAVFWGVSTLAALAAGWRERAALRRELGGYGRFLRVPWKLVTFGISGGFFLIIAPYTPDPTWDRIDAGFMSLGTYLTAPWSIGTLVRVLRRRAPVGLAAVALVLWAWTASWSYDAYIWWRDGVYPHTWWSNIIASSVLYVSAGMFWSLEHREDLGVTFTFLQEGWAPQGKASKRLLVLAIVLGGMVAAMMLPFVWDLLR